MKSRTALGSRIAPCLPPVLLILLILMVAWHRGGGLRNPELIDQADYLHIGLLISEGRGLTDGSRHPLYPAMLAPFAERDHDYYASAKIVTLGLSLVSFSLMAWLIARRFGPGMATAVLIALGTTLVWTASGLRCEVLLYPLILWFWEAGTEGFRRSSAWIQAGCAAGLFYLTKPSGTVLAAAFVLTWVLAGEWRSRRRWRLGLFLVPFAAVISPVAYYNLIHYGSPFYNFISNHAMWIDHWNDVWVVKTPLPTFGSWWAEHRWYELITREIRGILSLPDWHWFLLFFIAVAAAVVRRRRNGEREEPDLERQGLTLASAVVGGHAVLLGWWAYVVTSVHHVMPIQPLAAVVIFSEAARRIPRRWKLEAERLRPAFTGFLALLVLVLPFVLDLRDPYSLPLQTYPEIEEWIREGEESAMVYGPSQNFPRWMFEPDFDFVPVPSDVSLAELKELMREREIRFLLVDGEAVTKRPILGAVALEDPGLGLVEAPTDHGFRPRLEDPSVPPRWILFELE